MSRWSSSTRGATQSILIRSNQPSLNPIPAAAYKVETLNNRNALASATKKGHRKARGNEELHVRGVFLADGMAAMDRLHGGRTAACSPRNVLA